LCPNIKVADQNSLHGTDNMFRVQGPLSLKVDPSGATDINNPCLKTFTVQVEDLYGGSDQDYLIKLGIVL
jgi:hypothetical protein